MVFILFLRPLGAPAHRRAARPAPALRVRAAGPPSARGGGPGRRAGRPRPGAALGAGTARRPLLRGAVGVGPRLAAQPDRGGWLAGGWRGKHFIPSIF